MNSLNEVTLIGNIGGTPEKKQSKNGKVYVALSLATNEKWKDTNGNPQEHTEWHNLKFYDKLAEIVATYVNKGDKLYCRGKIRTSEYQDEAGVQKRWTEVIVKDVVFLGQKEGKQKQTNAIAQAIEELGGDDIPF